MRRPALPPCCRCAVAAAVLIALAPAAASATTLTAPSIISNFNLVASGNVTSTEDIEGSAVIGGDLSGGTFFNNRAPSNPVVYLYGAQSGTTSLDTGALYYGSIGGSVVLNSGASKQQGGWPNPSSAYFSVLNAYSTQLAKTLAPVGNSATLNGGTLTFNGAQADANGDAFVAITLATLQSDFNSASTIAFSLGSGVKTIIIDVTGSGSFANGSAAHFSPQSAAQDVLFNFTDATSLTLDSWETSVLAPDAATTTSNAFEGFLYTDTLEAGGELHNLPVNTPLPPPVGVPEPATIALLGAGIAAIAARRRAA